jgi:hypothetical protein
MNAEKVYAAATKALRSIIDETSDSPARTQKIFDQVMNNPEEWEWSSPFLYELGKLAREAKEEIVSKDGKKDALAACKAIIKVAKGINHEEIHGAWIDKDGWQVVCDSFRAVRMKDHLEALPSAHGSEIIGRVWESARGNSVEVKLPTIGEVKEFIASEKAAGKKDFRYDFGEGMPAVNANYLLDLLKIGLDETAMISKKAPLISAIYMRGEGVEAFLMPVRKADK